MLGSLLNLFSCKVRKTSRACVRGLQLESLELRECPATATWLGGVSSGWFVAGNWQNGIMPNDNDHVVIKNNNNSPIIPDMVLDEEMNATPYHPQFSSFTLDASFGASKYVFLDASASFVTGFLYLYGGGGINFGTTSVVTVTTFFDFTEGSLLGSGGENAGQGLVLGPGTMLANGLGYISGNADVVTVNIFVGYEEPGVPGIGSIPSRLVLGGMDPGQNLHLNDGAKIYIARHAKLLLVQDTEDSSLTTGGISTNCHDGSTRIQVDGDLARFDSDHDWQDGTELLGILIGPKIVVTDTGSFEIGGGHKVTMGYQEMGIDPVYSQGNIIVRQAGSLVLDDSGQRSVVVIGTYGRLTTEGLIHGNVSVGGGGGLIVGNDGDAYIVGDLSVSGMGSFLSFMSTDGRIVVTDDFSMTSGAVLYIYVMSSANLSNRIYCNSAFIDSSQIWITHVGNEANGAWSAQFIITADDDIPQSGTGFTVVSNTSGGSLFKEEDDAYWAVVG